MKQQFLKAKVGTIRLSVYDKNVEQIPASALITLYKTDGTSILQSQASATVNGTTGEMTYTLTTTHTADKGVNFKAIWEYVISGVTYYETSLFDVVLSILSIPITDEDLYKELPSLRKANYQQSGTATAGTSTSITDTARRKEPDDYWKGGILEIISGTGVNQSRTISTNVQSSGVISVSLAFTTTPDSTSVYRVIKSFSNMIEQSFEKIEQLLYNKGRRPDLIIESSQIRLPMIYMALATIAIDLSDEVDDRWDKIYKVYSAEFEKTWNGLKLDYDEDESGGIQGQEAQHSINEINIYRA